MLTVRVLAPYARGLPHGGSQRTTALAERLEARGFAIDWLQFARRPPSRRQRAISVARRRPVLALEWTAPDVRPRRADVVLAAQSFFAAHVPSDRPGVIDFQNLEHQHLIDVSAGAAGARRPWLRFQAGLMERLEASAVSGHDLSLFTGEEEIAWARRLGPRASANSLVVPNRLPAEAQREAAAIKAARRRGTQSFLAYVGTLRFPPNAVALEKFLSDVWPHLRAQQPGLELHVAGGLTPPHTETLPTAPGVIHHGFVERLEPLLSGAGAVVFPFAGAAGSSLRALFLALAGVPLIGPPQAFRGHGSSLGYVAESPPEWQEALTAALREPVAEAASAAADALQRDEAPWDALASRLLAVTA